MMTILNAADPRVRRSASSRFALRCPALPAPADQTSALDLFFREKALSRFQRSYRMDDLRRLVRQYGRTQDKVFPTGNFTRNGTPSGQFGTQVAFSATVRKTLGRTPALHRHQGLIETRHGLGSGERRTDAPRFRLTGSNRAARRTRYAVRGTP